ncbi:hypothetical protein [Blautia massiliensis (ex Durand et al. 2017)]|uniref:hypothetical protein n=1 Tax=Blautia massiliensis (ex Durand et al. 2017) TaxID=1737424 RepID=UPI00189FCF35|nr:hypothetical protein [Blautia massiliensis (ex Durand et al. 2017)]
MPYYKRFLYVVECIHPRNVIPELFFRHIWRHFRAPCQPVFFADSFNMLNKIKKRTFFLKLFLWILSTDGKTVANFDNLPALQDSLQDFIDTSPALPESLPICAANVKQSRQAERSTAFAADKRGTIGHISHKKKDDGLPVIPYP